ncbi:MAG: DUF192 domain-containing protein [Campylobacteraceae bacterium]|nr:DUF192 domain-containing protein [Campylobacteraceae bacterium]
MMRILFFILALTGLIFAQDGIKDNERCKVRFDNGVVLRNVEAAVSSQKMATGLSQREDISDGMIFVFPEEDFLYFWMKDTLVDISIGFFDKEMTLLQVIDMSANTLDIHKSNKKAKYALELKKGSFEKLSIKAGDKIESLRCKNKWRKH